MSAQNLSETWLRDEICRVGKSLFDRGYVHATAGNISVALPQDAGGGFLITPTDACLGFLDPAKLAKVNSDGEQVSGDRASKTLALHKQIYAASAKTAARAACVIHTHSSHCVALTLQASHATELMPPITPYFVMKVGHVPIIPYHLPGDVAAADLVAQTIQRYANQAQDIRAVMLSKLGPNVWHDTPAAAMAVLEELEETAKLWWMSEQRAPSLDESAIAQLREKFGIRW